MKRNYEGTTRLQGVGECQGIKAINVKVGDYRVWNFGSASEVIRVEPSKTGKTVKITTLWFNKHAKLVNGEWVGAWEEDTRTLKAETIVVVKELNPAEEVEVETVEETVEAEAEVVAEEVEAVETAEEIARRIVANRPRRERKPAFQRWIETFIEEKGLDLDHEFTIEHDGNIHFLTLEFLVELMIKAPKNEQLQIKEKVVYIDFKNGDVMHFFNFLAGAYIKTNY